jgi:hypothetical protein
MTTTSPLRGVDYYLPTGVYSANARRDRDGRQWATFLGEYHGFWMFHGSRADAIWCHSTHGLTTRSLTQRFDPFASLPTHPTPHARDQ